MNFELPQLTSPENANRAIHTSKRKLPESQIEDIVRLVKAREWLSVNAVSSNVNDSGMAPAESDWDADSLESHIWRLFQEFGLRSGSFQATVQKGEITTFRMTPNDEEGSHKLREFVLLTFAHRGLKFGIIEAQVTESTAVAKVCSEGRHIQLGCDRTFTDA